MEKPRNFSLRCREDNCSVRGCYNYPGGTSATLRCATHKKEGMSAVCVHYCQSGCGTMACFNLPNTKPPKFCKKHMEPGMICVISKRCESDGCHKKATFGNAVDSIKKFCGEHSGQNMINLDRKRCEEVKCQKSPIFNYKGNKTGRFCKEHAKPNMLNVQSLSSAICQFEGCDTQCSFANPGEKAAFCQRHASPDMINVRRRKCKYNGCNDNAYYALPDESPLFCRAHASEEMTRSNYKPNCYYNCCEFKASFGFVKSQPMACSSHKTDEMIYVTYKECEIHNCHLKSTYGIPGNLMSRCNDHKETGMISNSRSICQIEGCTVLASFGQLFSGAIHCLKHKKNNEYGHRDRYSACAIDDCNAKACYATINTNYPTKCETHKSADDYNVLLQRCRNCNLPDYISNQALLCNDCASYIIEKRQKVKENKIGDLLKYHQIQCEASDSKVIAGCSRYRPDFVIDYILYKVIIEVDENQHMSYAPECELARMVMIHQDFGGIPVLFIRFNPDSYTTNGVTIKEYNGREQTLLTLLASLKNVKELKHPLVVTHLYYDGFTGMLIFHSADYFNKKVEQVWLSN